MSSRNRAKVRIKVPAISAPSSELRQSTVARPFARDPLWWGVCIAAVLLSAVVRVLLSTHRGGWLFYAAGVPLVTVLTIVAYRRWRIRVSWLSSIAVGLACAAITLAIGWFQAQFL